MGNTADTPQDRSVHVGGDANRNVITTGYNNTVTVGMQEITLPAPDTVDVTRELDALHEASLPHREAVHSEISRKPVETG